METPGIENAELPFAELDVLLLFQAIMGLVETGMEDWCQLIDRTTITLCKIRHDEGLFLRLLPWLQTDTFQLVQGSGRGGQLFIGRLAPEGLSAFEKTGQCIVITGGDGVVLMVVASCASHGKPHDATAYDVDLVCHDIHVKVVVHFVPNKSEKIFGDK